MSISDYTIGIHEQNYSKAWEGKNPRNSFDKNHYNIENHEETLYLYNISSNQLGINRKFTVQIFARNV